MAELENYRRQATLNDDQGKFDEPEVLMAIVAARLTCLEVKWSKYALKKRGKDEEVTFESLITFIEDEAAALEEPEGAKARARAHEFVTQLQRQSSFKRAPEKERWGGKGSKFDPLIATLYKFLLLMLPHLNKRPILSCHPTSLLPALLRRLLPPPTPR